MARVRDMQGVPAQIVTLKSDGKRRHPAHCIYAIGAGANRLCANPQCPIYYKHCKSATRCNYYEEKDSHKLTAALIITTEESNLNK